MIQKYLFLQLFILLFFLNSCTQRKSDVSDAVEILMQSNVVCPWDSMVGIKKDSFLSYDYTYIVYSDSSECSECVIKNKFYWESLVDSARIRKKNLNIVFIFEPKTSDMEAFLYRAKLMDVSCPIYVDTTKIFRRNNPQINDLSATHVFLINSNNNVVLVGNPLFNPKIEEMLLKIFEGKLGKGKNGDA